MDETQERVRMPRYVQSFKEFQPRIVLGTKIEPHPIPMGDHLTALMQAMRIAMNTCVGIPSSYMSNGVEPVYQQSCYIRSRQGIRHYDYQVHSEAQAIQVTETSQAILREFIDELRTSR